MISTKVSIYDIIIAAGVILTAIRMVAQYHVLRRIQTALHDAETEVARLTLKHPPRDDPGHQPVPSPPDEIVAPGP